MMILQWQCPKCGAWLPYTDGRCPCEFEEQTG